MSNSVADSLSDMVLEGMVGVHFHMQPMDRLRHGKLLHCAWLAGRAGHGAESTYGYIRKAHEEVVQGPVHDVCPDTRRIFNVEVNSRYTC
jgi:hypothetical protein